MTYFIDVDNTICKTEGGNYAKAEPMPERIAKINKLYDEGHKIVYVTARGAESGINWLPLTIQQFDSWGVKRHELRPKPYYDVLVDDRAQSDKQFFDVN